MKSPREFDAFSSVLINKLKRNLEADGDAGEEAKNKILRSFVYGNPTQFTINISNNLGTIMNFNLYNVYSLSLNNSKISVVVNSLLYIRKSEIEQFKFVLGY